MQSDIDYISFSPHFFIQLKKERVVIGHADLPDKLHLTLAGLSNSPDVNIHITNENGAGLKPRVTIAVADKKLIEQKAEAAVAQCLNEMLEPVRLRHRPRRNRLGYQDRAYWLRLDDLETNESFVPIKKELTRVFRENVKIERNTRLKIQPGILAALEKLNNSPVAKQFVRQNLKQVFRHPVSAAEWGFWSSDEYIGVAFILEGLLYKLRIEASMDKYLAVLIGESNAEAVLSQYEAALQIVANAADYSETVAYDTPLRVC